MLALVGFYSYKHQQLLHMDVTPLSRQGTTAKTRESIGNSSKFWEVSVLSVIQNTSEMTS